MPEVKNFDKKIKKQYTPNIKHKSNHVTTVKIWLNEFRHLVMKRRRSTTPAVSTSHPWEIRERALEGLTCDATDAGDAGDGDDGADFAAEEFDVSTEEAGDMLAQFLMSLHVAGQLRARSLCIICWWASKAGGIGGFADYAFRPNAPTGHFQRHVDCVNKVNLKDLGKAMLKLDLPMCSKFDASRSSHSMPVQSPHECLVQEVQDSPSILQELEDKTTSGYWPPAYAAHAVVRKYDGTGTPVLPYALYFDGTPTTKRDGVLAFWCYSLVSEHRWLLAVLRQSEMCRCGCLGWCSLSRVWQFLDWSISALANKTFPACDLDGNAFIGARAESAGIEMPFAGALLQIKGDWAEFCHSCGFPPWNTHLFPCMLCKATYADMHDFRNLCSNRCKWGEFEMKDYDKAVDACTKVVTIDRAAFRVIKNSLHYDKRKATEASRGRALTVDMPDLGLRKGDRLQPNPLLPDIGTFEKQTPPFECMFWRRTAETRVRQPNPLLMNAENGITTRTFCVDTLHCLYLGTALEYCCSALWMLIREDVFETESTTIYERQCLSTLRIRNELWQWYKDQRKTCKKKLTELENLVPTMLGTSKKPALSTKGAETKCLIPFCKFMLDQYQDKLGANGRALSQCGEALMRMVEIMTSAPFNMPAQECHKLTDACKRFLRLWQHASLPENQSFIGQRTLCNELSLLAIQPFTQPLKTKA